ncbi:2-trimethylaminoethylphosphonate dioxygenase [Nocardia acidivorans]|uniref:2-trimethylaminoethylphosphonate dioxygenase n=1 Tax=Nocardia acidivorans TaxID=404580 RepID=UPI000B2308B9|nr:TauD/TfdA family dioxygenase [Nocardia acidivorans]
MYGQVSSGLSVEAAVVDGDVRLSAAGRTVEIPAIWLRDNAPDADSRDVLSGQRLFNIVDLPADIRVREATVVEDRLRVRFTPGGHRTSFALDALLGEANRVADLDLRSERAKRLWRDSTAAAALEPVRWQLYLERPAPALRQVVEWGFVLLQGVPAEAGQVTKVAETFGYVRETNYGRIFDVRVEPNPVNLAFTGLAITPHTDNPYREPVPTLQLLLCLHNAAEGGDSGMVDGFAAAAELRETDRAAFDVLTTTPVTYRYHGDGARLGAVVPLIGLDAEQRIREIRFNNRSMEVPLADPERVRAFYGAYRRFAELLYQPEAQLNFRLDTGDCLIFDNTRALHARTAFAAAGGRHLQGTYADLDGLNSTLRRLEEQGR